MNVADLTGLALDYWVARSLPDFVREIYFTDSGETVAVRGSDRGRPWDGRFEPSTSWEAAGVVLDRARCFELSESNEPRTDEPARCVAQFEGSPRKGKVEARGATTREALLRAFVKSRFGDTVEAVLRRPQAVLGTTMAPVGAPSAIGDVGDLPRPDAQIGDIGAAPR
ncbi:phage protein NinX family protein [Paraburkholderia sacchari]|uniref:phage protein NinX family protein n=1 Tax=Paraburkholderia sacchari TaxID=159450 RepID=UPI001BD176AD|nr:phage protein NinX family protein [Paraburkholderia sacchari]